MSKHGKAVAGSATNLINHVTFVLDGSGSMQGREDAVVKVFDDQVKWLAEHSTNMGQETRVSVYIFNTDNVGNPNIQCLIYDKDVLRLPSLEGLYHPDNGTPLIDATLVAIDDLMLTPQKYGDHAFLVYVQTDGEENRSKNQPYILSQRIESLPENFTVAVLVPDQKGVFLAKQFGFPANNIDIWDATSRKGVEDSGQKIRTTTAAFFKGRSQGVRGTKSLFKVDTANLNTKTVRANLVKVKPSGYVIYQVPQGLSDKDSEIKEFVTAQGITFRKGIAFYQLSKKVTVQGYKGIYVWDRKTCSLYTGDNVRTLLGLPASNVDIVPGDFCDYDIFIQSTSTNRKLVGGTKLLVIE